VFHPPGNKGESRSVSGETAQFFLKPRQRGQFYGNPQQVRYVEPLRQARNPAAPACRHGNPSSLYSWPGLAGACPGFCKNNPRKHQRSGLANAVHIRGGNAAARGDAIAFRRPAGSPSALQGRRSRAIGDASPRTTPACRLRDEGSHACAAYVCFPRSFAARISPPERDLPCAPAARGALVVDSGLTA
jgi:hypothetical protein